MKELFDEFNEADGRQKAGIAKAALHELEVHAALEERLIYPAIRKWFRLGSMLEWENHGFDGAEVRSIR